MTTPVRNQANVVKAYDRVMDSAKLISYLPLDYVQDPAPSPAPPIGSFQTDDLSIGVWTKLLIPTTAKKLKEWAIVDIGGGDLRYQFQGTEPKAFLVNLITGASSSTLDTRIEFAMAKGAIGVDQDVLETGAYASALAKAAGSINPLGMLAYFTVVPLDVIAVFVRVDKICKAQFSGLSIAVLETN